MKATLIRSMVLGSAATSIFAAVSHAAIIGIDFNNAGSTNQAPASTDVVGPMPSAGWNNLVDITNPPTSYYNHFNPSDHGSPLTLKDSTGATTTATFGFNNFGLPTYNGGTTNSPSYGGVGAANAGLTPNQQLYNGATNSGAGGVTQEVTLNNIPYSSYSVYLMVDAATGNAGFPNQGVGSVQIFNGGLTPTAPAGTTYWFESNANTSPIPTAGFAYLQATSTSQGSPTAGANYALFSGLTGTTETFDVSAPAGTTDNGAYFGAIEIVDTSAAVPEPATLSLLGLGSVGLMFRRRRHA